MKTKYVAISSIFLLILLMAISGCGPSADEQAYVDVPLHRQDTTKYYQYNIRLPEIIRTNKVLRDTLTALADKQQKSFTANIHKDTTALKSYAYPWELILDFSLQDSTNRFISLLGKGYQFTGGAHGMPFFITLNYDREEQQIVPLPKMLGDSTALQPISRFVRDALARHFMHQRNIPVTDQASVDAFLQEQGDWVKDGTAPSYSNYNNFLLRPQGIRFIFGAYQVGPYVIGTPEVEVPASVFREELEAGYGEWFTVETEDSTS